MQYRAAIGTGFGLLAATLALISIPANADPGRSRDADRSDRGNDGRADRAEHRRSADDRSGRSHDDRGMSSHSGRAHDSSRDAFSPRRSTDSGPG